MEWTFGVNWSTEVTICQCLTIARKKILFFFKRSQVVENKEMHAFLHLPSPFIHPLLQRLAFLLIKTARISSITHTSRQPEHINSDQWKLGFFYYFFFFKPSFKYQCDTNSFVSQQRLWLFHQHKEQTWPRHTDSREVQAERVGNFCYCYWQHPMGRANIHIYFWI